MTESNVLEVILHLPGAGPRRLSGKATTTIAELLGDAGADRDLLIFEADADADEGDDDVDAGLISPETTIGDITKGRVAIIHCHCCRRIKVTVNYKADVLHRKFPPSTRARKVLHWAKHKLKLKDADADNLALFLCDGGPQVRDITHLGDLVEGGDCEICFDLSKDRNIEGAL